MEAGVEKRRPETRHVSVIPAKNPAGPAGRVQVVHGVHDEDDVGVELDRVGRIADEAVRRVVRGHGRALDVDPPRGERTPEQELELPAI